MFSLFTLRYLQRRNCVSPEASNVEGAVGGVDVSTVPSSLTGGVHLSSLPPGSGLHGLSADLRERSTLPCTHATRTAVAQNQVMQM